MKHNLLDISSILEYINDNFNIHIEAYRLIENILQYVDGSFNTIEEKNEVLHLLLDNTIGFDELDEITNKYSF